MMGAIHLEAENGKATWVFESYKHAIAAADVGFKDIGEAVGDIYATAMKAHAGQQIKLDKAEGDLKKQQE